MTLAEHIKELKFRLSISLIFMIFATVISYIYADKIFEIILTPLIKVFNEEGLKRQLIFTNLTEAFITKIRVAFSCGIIITFPIIAWQCYRFIAPGLFKKEKLAFLPYMIFSPILFVSGAYLAYAYIMPIAWKFFISFEQELSSSITLILEAKISEYVSLVTTMIIAFGVTFQLPLILILLVHVGLVSVDKLIASRKYAIVTIFIIAAFVTPPDVISQVILALPLILLYEISILICKRIKTKSKLNVRYKANKGKSRNF